MHFPSFNISICRSSFPATLLLLIALIFPSHSQAAAKLIIDTDMGADVDDVGALAIAHYYADRGQADLLAVMVSNMGGNAGWAVPAVDAVNTYYNRPDVVLATNRGPASAFGGDSSQFIQVIGSNGGRYGHDQRQPDAAEDAVTAYRRILATQPDKSVSLVVIGWLSNIANLMDSGVNHNGDSIAKTGKQLLEQKLKELVVMGGQYPSGLEFNFKFDGPSAARVIAGLDVPMVFTGYELGTLVQSGDTLVSTPYNNPVREGYRLYGKGEPFNRSSWDLTAVVYAVEGLGDFFSYSTPGKNQVFNDGANAWHFGDAKGDVFLKLKDSGARARLRTQLNTMLVAAPAECTLHVELTAKTPSCVSLNGSVTSDVYGGTPPYTYLWSTGATSPSLEGIQTSNVSLTVSDSAGCSVVRTVSYSPVTSESNVLDAYQSLGRDAAAKRTTKRRPFDIFWSSEETDSVVGNLSAGDYNVTLNDASDCSVEHTFELSNEATFSEMYLEAECAQLVGVQWVEHDFSPASGGKYVAVSSSVYNFSPAGVDASMLEFELDLDEQTDYALYARVLTPDAGADSLWFRVNGGDWSSWHLGPTSQFAWKNWSLPVAMLNGSNKLEIAFREGGVKLDKVFISRDGSTPEGTSDVAHNCF